jgi:predicted ATPase
MIRRIKIDNFKSLDGFTLPTAGSPPLVGFTCLIGANGSGKTTVLQAIDFLAHLATGRLTEWLNERGWSPDELFSQFDYAPDKYIEFSTELKFASTKPITWKCKFLPLLHDSTVVEESIWENNHCLLDARGSKVSFMPSSGNGLRENSGLQFSGSALSILANDDIDPSLQLIKQLFSNYLSNFELVSTFNLKQDSYPSQSIGPRGENLVGFLHEMSDGLRDRVYTRMKEFFPSVTAVQRELKQNGVIKMSLIEKNLQVALPGPIVSDGISSRHFSDGFTRILAIISQIESAAVPGAVNAMDRVLLLDEIENGIHPEMMAKLVEYLASAPVQIIATTHSPMILNYLSDSQAAESVVVLYRNSEGKARSCRYFDLPSAKKKLGILGPGEVYVDTSIEQIAREAEKIEKSASSQTDAAKQ